MSSLLDEGADAVAWLRGSQPRMAALYVVYEIWHWILRAVTWNRDDGTVPYDRDWDVLVVLDGCRADLLAEVSDDYQFLSAGSARSPASTSEEWMSKTFGDGYADERARTAYITGNPYSDRHCDAADFARLDEVWAYGWDDDLGTIPPDALTDRAIRTARDGDHDRLIVHYMQPHFPFVPDPLDEGVRLSEFGRNHDPSVWEHLRAGNLTLERAWRGYRANLRYVLDEVAVLLSNIDAERVVITADHGNGVGEWGVYGHPSYVDLPPLRRVPWVETSATDTGNHEPADPARGADGGVDGDVADRLEDLGYR